MSTPTFSRPADPVPIIGLSGAKGSGKDLVAQIICRRHLVEGLSDDGSGPVDVMHRHPDLGPPLMNNAVQLALADEMKVFCHRVYGFSRETLWGESARREAPDDRWPQEHEFVRKADDKPRRGLARVRLSGGRTAVWACTHCGLELERQDGQPGIADDLTPCGYLTAREALQKLGTEYGRALHQDTWIRPLIARARRMTSAPRVRKPGASAHTFAPNWYLDRTDLIVVSDVRFINEMVAIQAAGGVVWQIRRPEPLRIDNGHDQESALRREHASETEQLSDEAGAHIDTVIYNSSGIPELLAQVRAHLTAAFPVVQARAG